VQELSGCLPDNAKDMEAKIPGIGRYSAGAICSIAYNQKVPVVGRPSMRQCHLTNCSCQPPRSLSSSVPQLDGNVHRLLSRLLALHAPPKAKATLDLLWSGATVLVECTDRPGDLNQALIELGSTVCKVHDPACISCPLRQWCKAYQRSQGKVGAFPTTPHNAGRIAC
jgi:A/G-specific adenine glycosylase